MGISACISNRKLCQRSKNIYSQYPEDIEIYKSQAKGSLHKIKFHALLSNIRIFNFPKNGLSLKFCIDDVNQVLLPRKFKAVDSNEIKWVLKEKFQFIVDQYELRLKFLHVSVTDDVGKTTNCLKINLYKIATGPYHNDFSLFSKHQTRLKFDFKVSQFVQMKVQCKETFASLNKKQYPGQSFYFTIRVLRQQKQQPFESAPSYPQTTPFSKNQKPERMVSQYDQCPSPIKIKGKLPPKPVITSCQFLWTADKGDMPSFKIFLQADQIQKTILHLVIWRSQKKIQPSNQANEQQEDVDMFCEAYTPITKILLKQPLIKNDANKNLKIQQRQLSLKKQGLWSGGQKIGQFSMKMRVQNNTFIKQMKACTLTQTGIIESMPFFTKYGTNKQNKKKFQQIEKSLQIIKNSNKQINESYNLSSYELQRFKDQMVEQFNKMRKYVEDDLQKSFFVPQTQQQVLSIIQDQTLLLSFVQRVLNYAQDDDSLTDVSWRIIVHIMKRGQFTLSNIGFSKNDQHEMRKNNINLYKKKIKVALQYQEIQYKLLLQSLRIGYIEGRDDPRQAIQMYRAFAYFIVPQYRQMILKMVVRKDDMTIEWNTNITDGDMDTPQAQNILSAQIDWQNCFYKPLQIQSKSQMLIKQIVQNLQGSLWLQQISKRGSTFFYFLYFLILKLTQLGKRIKFIKWQYFPGYNKLIRAFLFQMKNIKVQRYPPSLIQASINLLANERLLNILMTIVCQKTNLNDCNGLMKCLDLVSRYLNYFTKKKKLLPTSFNYVYFFKALKIVLQCQFSYAVVKALAIIFTNYDNFNIQFRRNLALYLMGKVFFKLFLNWSFTTRKAFYHVLILKIQRASDIFDPDSRKQFSNKHQLMNQIGFRYQQCFKMVRNAYQINKQDISYKFRKNQKDLYKNLKRKLAAKRKKQNQKTQIPNIFIKQPKLSKRQSNLFINTVQTARQKQNNPQQKYSIRQLTKVDSAQRTYSAKLDANILKLTIQNIRKQSLQQPKNQQKLQQQSYPRTKSGTTYVDINDNNQYWKDTNLKPKKLKQRKRSIYGMDQFQITEMSKKQIQYLAIAIKQFDNLDEAIRKYYLQNNCLPICQLDVEVPIDQKQIKPLSADFQQWESTQSQNQTT